MLDFYNDHGQTALHIAQIHGHEEIAGLLTMAGAKTIPMLPCIIPECSNRCRTPHNCEEVHPLSK